MGRVQDLPATGYVPEKGRENVRSRMIGAAACAGAAVVAGWGMSGRVQAADPWADRVVSYERGRGFSEGYTNPTVALGEPTRYTGESFGYPGAVTPFNPAFEPDEIVSVGAGGHLTVSFAEPIRDLHGKDFIIFGNGGFIDSDYPNGRVGGVFADGPFRVSVSRDGVNFVPLEGLFNDATFPMLGYLDLDGPYDPDRGTILSDYTRPINPLLKMEDFFGRTFQEVVALYDGSGGGLALDFSTSGLSEIHFVRIDVPDGSSSPEIDAFAVIPEPPSALALFFASVAAFWRRKKQ